MIKNQSKNRPDDRWRYTKDMEKTKKDMITEDDIKRINELHHKFKNEGLTEEEKQEQQKLRAAYIETMRNHIRTHLDNVVIQRPDGSREKLKKK